MFKIKYSTCCSMTNKSDFSFYNLSSSDNLENKDKYQEKEKIISEESENKDKEPEIPEIEINDSQNKISNTNSNSNTKKSVYSNLYSKYSEESFNKEKEFKNISCCQTCKEFLIKHNKIEEWDEIKFIIGKYFLKEDGEKLLFGNTSSDKELVLNSRKSNIKGEEIENFEEEEVKNVSLQGKCSIF